MAIRDLKFTIKVTPWGAAAQKDAGKLTAELKTQDKATKVLVESTKKHAKGVGEAAVALTKFEQAGKQAGRAIESAMGGVRGAVNSTAMAVDSLNTRLGKIGRSVFTLKNAIAGSIIGGAALKLGGTALEQGQQQIAAERKARRQFGAKEGGSLIDLANATGKRAGIQGDDALRGLLPIMETIQDTTQAGTMYRGKKLTNESAMALRQKNLGFAAKLFERASILNPDVESEDLGRALAAAGTGKEGMRGLSSLLHLNKATVARVEKDGEKKHLGRGDIVEKLFEASFITDGTAADESKTLGFTLKSAKAQAVDKLGDVGAEQLRKVSGAGGGGFADLVGKLPGALDYLGDHAGTILGATGVAGTGYGALSLLGGKLAKGGGVGGLVGGALEGSAGGDGMRVFVTNMKGGMGGDGGAGDGVVDKVKGVATAGAGWLAQRGLTLGTLGIAGATLLASSDSTAETEKKRKEQLEGGAKMRSRSYLGGLLSVETPETPEDLRQDKLQSAIERINARASIHARGGRLQTAARGKSFTPEQFAQFGESMTDARGAAAHTPSKIEITVNSILDGVQVARSTAAHVLRDAKNATAGGAAR